MVAAQIEAEDNERMKAIENDETPPELRPSAGGPVVAGVPIENVSLPMMGDENGMDSVPGNIDSL